MCDYVNRATKREQLNLAYQVFYDLPKVTGYSSAAPLNRPGHSERLGEDLRRIDTWVLAGRNLGR